MIALLVTLLIYSALAGPNAVNLQGRLFDRNGEVIDDGIVPVVLEVRDPSGQCLLFKENHNIDMSGTDGFFSVALGQGTQETSTAPSFDLVESFSNKDSLNHPLMACSGNSYSPSFNDHRLIRITIDGDTLSPDQQVNAIPYAVSSNSLNGYTQDDFIQIDGAAVTQENITDFFEATASCTADNFIRWDGSAWQCEPRVDNDTTYSAADMMTAIQTLDSDLSGLNSDTLDSQQGSYYLDYGNFTNTPVIPDGHSLNAADNDPADALYVDDSGDVGIGTASPNAKLDVTGDIKIGDSGAICDSTTEGRQRYNSTSKLMEFCNGTNWISMIANYSGNFSTATGSCSLGQNGGDICTANADCPSGYKVISGGYHAPSSSISVRISRKGSDTRWTCVPSRIGSVGSSHTVTCYAYCLEES